MSLLTSSANVKPVKMYSAAWRELLQNVDSEVLYEALYIVTEICGFERRELRLRQKYKFYTILYRDKSCPEFLDLHPAFNTISSCYFTYFLVVFYVLSITILILIKCSLQ
jgi:hypothetical protein